MFLQKKDIENIAESYVDKYYLLPGISDRPVHRINPVILSECVLNVKVEYSNLSPDGSILGITAYEDTNIIYCNKSGKEILRLELEKDCIKIEKSLLDDGKLRGRHNFTVAHEAGHIILKRLYPDKYLPGNGKTNLCRLVDISYDTVDSKAEEWQANAVASALLMPKDLVTMFLYGMNVTKPIRLYKDNKLLTREKRILEAFCRIFEVSKTAAIIRLTQLGYTCFRSESQYWDDYDYDKLTGGRI